MFLYIAFIHILIKLVGTNEVIDADVVYILDFLILLLLGLNILAEDSLLLCSTAKTLT